jgi:signal transduction histidine kinase
MDRIDPAVIIGDVAELYEPAAEDAGLKLVVEARSGLAVDGNRELMSLAIANLVDNAIKYSTVAGPPGAGRGEVRITLEAVGGDAEIAVSDRGPGVAPEDRKRALQRFVRLERSRSRPGAGLGLSLVAAVAHMHGGSIRLEDNAPGLRAVVTFPLSSPAERANAVQATA